MSDSSSLGVWVLQSKGGAPTTHFFLLMLRLWVWELSQGSEEEWKVLSQEHSLYASPSGEKNANFPIQKRYDTQTLSMESLQLV